MIRRGFHATISLNKKGTSSTEWLRRQRNDSYVQKSKADGYRARSAYKLIEMNQKYNRKLLGGPGAVVMECGAAPGAWTQVAAEAVNAGGYYEQYYKQTPLPSGIVVGCDLLNIEPVPGAILFSKCDFTSEESQQRILDSLGEERPKFDVVLSDMAPNASGQRHMDQDRILLLSYLALRFALQNSNEGSNFVTKVWGGNRVDSFVQNLKTFYRRVDKVKPQASRKESGEIYIVALDSIGIKPKTSPEL